jgi:hypothetical protein
MSRIAFEGSIETRTSRARCITKTNLFCLLLFAAACSRHDDHGIRAWPCTRWGDGIPSTGTSQDGAANRTHGRRWRRHGTSHRKADRAGLARPIDTAAVLAVFARRNPDWSSEGFAVNQGGRRDLPQGCGGHSNVEVQTGHLSRTTGGRSLQPFDHQSQLMRSIAMTIIVYDGTGA